MIPISDLGPPDAATNPIEVILADIHALTRMGMRTLLERDSTMQVVAEVTSGAALINQSRRLAPSVTVVDINLPDTDIASVVRSISTPVLVVGEPKDEGRVLPLLCAGARGFASKIDPPDDLVRAVRAVANGYGTLTPRLTGALLDWLADGAVVHGSALPTDRMATLTLREREILRLVAEGLSNEQIASALVLRQSTVKSHVYHLLKKLGLNDRAQAVAFAYRTGAVRLPPPPTLGVVS
jgi:DNA-binding NarL/FixJ family response regulator